MSGIEVLSQHIDDEAGYYRICARERVYYVHIPIGTFDDTTMCRPYLLVPRLPELPPGEWTWMRIRREHDGTVKHEITWDPMPSIVNTWHHKYVDVLGLKPQKFYRSSVQEVIWEDRPAVAKICCFEWYMPQMATETAVYRDITQYRPSEMPEFTPAFLAHLTQNGHVIGILLEKLEGRHASLDDLPLCIRALRQLHDLEIVHGDINPFNFIINDERMEARLIDFEYAQPYEKVKAEEELLSIETKLRDSSGRGGVKESQAARA